VIRIVIDDEAEQDLVDAIAYAYGHSRAATVHLIERFHAALEMLASGLVEGRGAALKDGRALRAWSMPPYVIYYRREGNTLQILRVHHQSRRPIERS
jgi:plasmid stabilization system protein ParE